jgi:hypothetical protein
MLSGVEGLHLTTINLTSCSAITQEGFHRLAAASPHLSVVSLANCRRVFAGLKEASWLICRGLGQLTSLNLSNLSMPHFSAIGVLQRLQHLVLDNLDAPGDEILAGLRQLDAGRLVSLQARYLSVSGQALQEFIGSRPFPRLRRLDLSHGCEGVVNDEVLTVSSEDADCVSPRRS